LPIFVYGKKQARIPKVVAGFLLLAICWVVSSPFWMLARGIVVVGAPWAGTRAGL